MNPSAFRSIRVFLRLLPFLLSFLRDWKRWLLFGGRTPRTPDEHQRRAEALRETMAGLGPTFIKGAQVLAMREDIIPAIYAEEFKKLQDRVPPFPLKDVERTIGQALGRPAREIFDEFDAEPLAAASLGQVHRAVYKGRPVAVKVLRPGVLKLVETDLRVVDVILAILDLVIEDAIMRSFRTIVREYERMIHQESDFRNERLFAARLRKNLEGRPGVRVPGCVQSLTTRRTSVFEFVEGVRVDDKAATIANGMEPRALIDLLIDTYVRMAVVDGFVHADPHPGNLLVDGRGRLVILDYGMSVEFDNETRLELLALVNAVVRRDIDRIVEAFYNLDMVEEGVNKATLRDAAKMLLNIQLDQKLSTRQVQELIHEIVQTFSQFPVRMPSQLVYLLRASALVEGNCLQYDPLFNAIREATPVVKRMLREIAFKAQESLPRQAAGAARRTASALKATESIIHRLDREELSIRLSARDLVELENFLRIFLRRLLWGIAMAAVAVCGALVHLANGSFFLLICTTGTATLGFLLAVLLPIRRRAKRNFSPSEFRFLFK